MCGFVCVFVCDDFLLLLLLGIAFHGRKRAHLSVREISAATTCMRVQVAVLLLLGCVGVTVSCLVMCLGVCV